MTGNGIATNSPGGANIGGLSNVNRVNSKKKIGGTKK
jgi:hypothetical protein